MSDQDNLRAMISLACDAARGVAAVLLMVDGDSITRIDHRVSPDRPVPVDAMLAALRSGSPTAAPLVSAGRWTICADRNSAPKPSVLALLDPDDPALMPRLHRAVMASARDAAGDWLVAKAESLLSNIEAMAGIGVWDANLATGAMTWSEVVYKLHGIDPGARPPTLDEMFNFFRADVRAMVRQHIASAIEAKSGFSLTLPFHRADGMECTMRMVGHVADIKGETRMFGILQDVTIDKEAEKRLWWTANHDQLTKLPNRMLFQERLSNALSVALSTGMHAGLILVDVDHFKAINDVYGHEAGDELLRLVAEQLGGYTRQGDTLARLGGDEFAVIVNNLKSPDELEHPLERLIEAAGIDLTYRGVSIPVKLSLGAAVFPRDASSESELYRNADLALFSAKADSNTRGLLYHPRLGVEQDGREAHLQRIRTAVAQKAVQPFAMPVVDLDTGQMASFDVVPRWLEGETVHPEAALTSALKDPDLAPSIGIEMIQRLAATLGSVPVPPEDKLSVSLATSRQQLLNLHYMAALSELFDAYGGPDGRFQIQLLTDTAPNELNLRHGAGAFEALVGRGLGVSVSRFGAGLVALLEASETPLREIKIPKSVVLETDRQERTGPLLHGAASACRRLGVEIVVTGVTTQGEVDALRAMGFTRAQGPLLSRAIELNQMANALATPKEASADGVKVPVR